MKQTMYECSRRTSQYITELSSTRRFPLNEMNQLRRFVDTIWKQTHNSCTKTTRVSFSIISCLCASLSIR